MDMRTKPLIAALALALGVSGAAFAQAGAAAGDNAGNGTSSSSAAAPSDNGGNTDSRTNVNSPVKAMPPAGATVGKDMDEEHGGTRSRMKSKTGATGSTTYQSEDARERAERAATTTADEEHGGLRNRAKNATHRAKSKLTPRGSDASMPSDPVRDDSGGLPGSKPKTTAD